MWTRAELKEKAKIAFKNNYWKVILVTLIIYMIGASSTIDFSSSSSNSNSGGSTSTLDSFMDSFEQGFDAGYGEEGAWDSFTDDSVVVPDYTQEDIAGMEYSDQYNAADQSEEYWDGYWDGFLSLVPADDASKDYTDGYNDGALDAISGEDIYEEEDATDIIGGGADASVNQIFDSLLDDIEDMGIPVSGMMAFAGVFIILFVIILIIVVALAILIATFIFSPLEVGARRFYLKNLNQPAEVKEVAYAFDNSYKNVVKILFFRNLYTFLWSLLFVIPGIVKSYEYMMIPYLLAENPELTQEQAFALSKQMMTGNKWKTYVLHLSFIGWDILSGCTLGILGIFYVEPYRNQTYAALYEELSLIHGRPAFATQGYAEYTYQQANPYEQTSQSTTYEEPTQGMTYEQPAQNTIYELPQAETNENTYTSPEQEEN